MLRDTAKTQELRLYRPQLNVNQKRTEYIWLVCNVYQEKAVKTFGHKAQQWKLNSAYRQHLTPTGDGGVLIWACFAATGPGHLTVTESTMKSSAQLGPNCVMQQENDTNTATTLQQID